MNHDLHAAIDRCDAEILATTRVLAQKWLTLGYEPSDLPTLLKPFLRQVAALRARHIEPLEALCERSEGGKALH